MKSNLERSVFKFIFLKLIKIRIFSRVKNLLEFSDWFKADEVCKKYLVEIK